MTIEELIERLSRFPKNESVKVSLERSQKRGAESIEGMIDSVEPDNGARERVVIIAIEK